MAFQILVPLDGTARAAVALDWADALVAALEAALTLIKILDEPQGLHALPGEDSTMLAHAGLARAAHRLRFVREVQTLVASGPIGATIAVQARALSADLVIMTARPREGLARALAGSVTATVIREAGVPVLIVRADLTVGPIRPPLRILVPLDGSALSAQVLAPLMPLASILGASLLLLMILQRPDDGGDGDELWEHIPSPAETAQSGAEAYLLRTATTLTPRGIPVETAIRWGEPATEIVRFARGARTSMIAMSTHGREGLERLRIGSVTEAVVRAAPVPVLAIHPFGAPGAASDLDECR